MMNERIKELAAEAYRSVNPGPDPHNEAEAAWSGFGPLERKFAELIVRECLETIEEMDPHSAMRDIDDIYVTVEKHFGVNE